MCMDNYNIIDEVRAQLESVDPIDGLEDLLERDEAFRDGCLAKQERGKQRGIASTVIKMAATLLDSGIQVPDQVVDEACWLLLQAGIGLTGNSYVCEVVRKAGYNIPRNSGTTSECAVIAEERQGIVDDLLVDILPYQQDHEAGAKKFGVTIEEFEDLERLGCLVYLSFVILELTEATGFDEAPLFDIDDSRKVPFF